MFLCVLFSFCLSTALAAKYQIRLFYNVDCPDERGLKGTAIFAAEPMANVVAPLVDRYDDETWFVARVEVSRNDVFWLSWHLFGETAAQDLTLVQGSGCVIAPREHTAQIIALTDPAFALPSCYSDADCDDGVNCTTTRCDTSVGYCNVHPRHDDCPNVCVPKTCFGGRRPYEYCVNNGDCVGGICSPARCVGGLYDGQPCMSGRYGEAGKRFGIWENYICENKGGQCLAGQPDTHCFEYLK